MKKIIIPAIGIIIAFYFSIAVENNSYAKSVSSNEDNSLENLENAIIIKGIESYSDKVYNNSEIDVEGTTIYKESFNKTKRVNEINRNTLKNLKKQDNRWHLTSYKIKKGENLWTIAKKHNVDYKIIISTNGINNPERLNPGRTISVPNKNGINYRVSKNDSIYKISKKYGIKKDLIIEQNNIKKDIIKEGELLFLPDVKEINRKPVKSVKKILNPEEDTDSPSDASEEVSEESQNPNTISAENNNGTRKPEFIWPLKGRITSAFGKRMDPIHNYAKFHCGLDISTNAGTPVRASADGEAIYCGWKKGYGRVVILKHTDGYITVYAHNKKNNIKPGDKIKKGKIIAYSGMSGAVTGPHLHFEIRKYLTPLNPLRLLEE